MKREDTREKTAAEANATAVAASTMAVAMAAASAGILVRRTLTHHLRAMDIHHHHPMACTHLRRRGFTPHLNTLHRGTRATSTTSNALTTRRRHRMESISSSTTTTMETRVALAPLGSSKDVWLLSAVAACWRNAAAASEMLDIR
ncbi:unnamed protein product [Miscanthus lutarioriparius]|uniref:Uncharacterized protein n=1 Tax=Miscanthus lutarioriparius TaxID=422564 RepID=A0A811R4B1_9POAL|nr:unnamed protein product [Miscanthus lutarioriparius]